MPGIYGYCKENDSGYSFDKMTHVLNYNREFIIDTKFEDNLIKAGKIHLGNVCKLNSHYTNKDIFVWIEGECYNLYNSNKILNTQAESFEELIAICYKEEKLKELLSEIDGYFACSIYDKKKEKVTLISDRYGMKMLYYCCKDGYFAWSSEVKGLLALDFIDKSVNIDSIDCFMDIGHLLKEDTWHKNIKLIKPASTLEYKIKEKEVSHKYYWTWAKIKKNSISFNEAVDELGKLLLGSVKKRFNPKEKIGIALSGGLDSRMIFAAINKLYPEYKGYAFTFGAKKSGDINIAKEVIKLSKWEHEIFYIDSSNWFKSRIEKIWYTDGMMNIMHMHGSEFLDTIKQKIDINLSGYLGDVVCGASYIGKLKNLERKIDTNYAKDIYQNYVGNSYIDDGFFDIAHVDPFLAMNRGRRFINMGIVNCLNKIDIRNPFFDNELIEFIYSIPDAYRFNNKLYSATLLKYFPTFFKDIPWEKTGQTINKPYKENQLIHKFIRKGARALNKIGLPTRFAGSVPYTDYPNWIKGDSTSNLLSELLEKKNSIYSKYTDHDFKEEYLLPHLKGKNNNSEKILRSATIELYFKAFANMKEFS
jgi:asparagine synthase (glutamine-hydrolysing)